METIWLLVGGALFLAGLVLAWWRWWARLPQLSPAARFTLIATTVGGLIGAVFWWQDVEVSFAWNLPPLASRMLGAAATAFGITGILALERPSPARAWLHAVMTAIYLAPLAVAIVLLHLDRFDFSAPISWSFFATVVVLSVAALAACRDGRGGPAAARPKGAEAGWLNAAGAVLAVWGVALFVAPAAPWPLAFPWPSDPLTSRLIAAMLMAVAAVFLLAARDARLTAQAHLLGAAYGIGVAVAVLVNVARGLPFPALYLAAFAAVGVVSAGFLLVRRRA